MEYLQYPTTTSLESNKSIGVLNLVINGIPSIPYLLKLLLIPLLSFKPCYKWNTFNT